MAQKVRDSFLDLEKHRLLLEDNVAKLSNSLRHYQTTSAQYEELKEEILAAKPTSREQLVAIARECGGELVSRKDVDELLGPATRDAAQVIDRLDHRLEWVDQNIRTLQKQLELLEQKLLTANIISTPEVLNEDGLPLTEIMEELDDDGNVISSSISTPGSAKPQLLEVLKKAGIELPEVSSTSPSAPALPTLPPAIESKTPPSPKPKPVKKGVQFTEDTKPGPEPQQSQTSKRIEKIMSLAKESEALPSERAVMPDESAADAALRREMLQYSMSEVGAVVAEINLEDGSDWEEDDYEDDDTSDEEDSFGRSTRKVVDDEYRQRMIELEERLGVRMMENVGKKASDVEIVREGIGRISVKGQAEDASEETETSSVDAITRSKKSVRFSEDLDISPAPAPLKPAIASVERTMAPVSDIVERNVPSQPSNAPAPQKKQSRFKSSRTPTNVMNGPLASSNTRQIGSNLPLFPAKPSSPKPFSQPIAFQPVSENIRSVPTGPEGKILAPQVVERDISEANTATEPDELDPQLLHQEVAAAYHKTRNKMIALQGGFMKEEESEIVPFTEEEGGPKKMSRFKAARLQS